MVWDLVEDCAFSSLTICHFKISVKDKIETKKLTKKEAQFLIEKKIAIPKNVKILWLEYNIVSFVISFL